MDNGMFEGSATIPAIAGKVQVIAKLGEGGMASVYLAAAHGPVGFSKLSVLKVIRPHLAEDPEILRMFLDEARLAGRLNHSNVVQTYEVGELDGQYVMVMEYLEGQPLRAIDRRVRQKQMRIPLPLHLKILIDALSGLHYAHELVDYTGAPLNLVHRDVSPHNVFITYDGQVKVLDFGIAKAANSSQDTKSGVIKGKFSYMAPEQFLSESVDRRADLYAMGEILWQVITGERLWYGLDDAAVVHRVTHGEIPLPSAVAPTVPRELEQICMRALATEPRDRYATAAEMQRDLRAFAAGLSTSVSALELGAFVSQEFAQERKSMRQRIEQQLSRTARSQSGRSIPPLNLQNPLMLSSASNPRWAADETPTTQHTPTPPPAIPSLGEGSGSGVSQFGAVADTMTAGRQPPSRKPLIIAAAIGALAALAFTLVLVVQLTGRDAPSPASGGFSTSPLTSVAATSASRPTLGDKPEAVELVEIRLVASPAHAQVWLDGRALSSNPAVQSVSRDDALHEVRVEAAGYRTKTVEVRADRAVVLQLELQKEVVAARVPPIAQNQPPAATAPTAETPRPDRTATPSEGDLKTDNINPWAP
jgi:serine/threonine-protein kinase